jgi:hypothetical protein
MIYRGSGFHVVICLLLLAPTSPSPVSKLDRKTQDTGRLRKRDNLLSGDGEGGAGGGAKSDDSEKDWSSINHSILSAFLLASFSLCDR